MEILFARSSGNKIEVNSGTKGIMKDEVSAPKNANSQKEDLLMLLKAFLDNC